MFKEFNSENVWKKGFQRIHVSRASLTNIGKLVCQVLVVTRADGGEQISKWKGQQERKSQNHVTENVRGKKEVLLKVEN